jgi:hypothetical protein
MKIITAIIIVLWCLAGLGVARFLGSANRRNESRD